MCARHVQHVVHVVSRRDVTWRAEWNLALPADAIFKTTWPSFRWPFTWSWSLSLAARLYTEQQHTKCVTCQPLVWFLYPSLCLCACLPVCQTWRETRKRAMISSHKAHVTISRWDLKRRKQKRIKLDTNRPPVNVDPYTRSDGDIILSPTLTAAMLEVYYRPIRRRFRENRSIALKWPLLMAERHRSAGEWLSWRSWSTHRPCGRPGRRFQSALENLLRERSTCSFKAWWARVETGHVAENRRPPFTDAVTNRWQSGTKEDEWVSE